VGIGSSARLNVITLLNPPISFFLIISIFVNRDYYLCVVAETNLIGIEHVRSSSMCVTLCWLSFYKYFFRIMLTSVETLVKKLK
jgi:hypothetical protein